MAQLTIDRRYLHRTLQQLVRINSVNPSLVPNGPGEEEIAYCTAERLRSLGLHVETYERHAGRPSVVGVLKGAGDRRLMLNAHYDTVGVEGMKAPFAGEIKGDRLYGRGAYDMKASLAACLAAVKSILNAGLLLAGDVVIAAVADEEYASLGTEEVLGHQTVDAAVVTEPTGLRVCLAHKGFLWSRFTVHGRAAHGSQYQEGIDANMKMGRVLTALESLDRQLKENSPHPLLGYASLHAALIEGGTGLSTYSERCSLKVERRTLPAEDPAAIEAEYRDLLKRLAAEDGSFRAEVERLFWREAFQVDREEAIVQEVSKAVAEVTKEAAEFSGENPWMDSALLAAAGVPTVVIGPSGQGAHSKEEWVDLQSVERLAQILARAAAGYLGPA